MRQVALRNPHAVTGVVELERRVPVRGCSSVLYDDIRRIGDPVASVDDPPGHLDAFVVGEEAPRPAADLVERRAPDEASALPEPSDVTTDNRIADADARDMPSSGRETVRVDDTRLDDGERGVGMKLVADAPQ